MIVELECTEINDELMLDIYEKFKCKIIKVRKGPNGFILLQVQGSEINLFKVWIKHWSSYSSMYEEYESEWAYFNDHIVEDKGIYK